MDIVGRLKLFLDYLGIPVTQFADNCGIPRPTLSQLLNGRNKTVRDEIIAKIHEAYPQLSIMWLMFGEGEMVAGENISENAFFPSEATDGDENQNLSDLTKAAWMTTICRSRLISCSIMSRCTTTVLPVPALLPTPKIVPI